MRFNKFNCGARFSSTTGAVRRPGLAVALAVTMLSVAPSSADAGWFRHITSFVSRATNPNGLNRFASRATNTHDLEHFAKTNIAGLERWVNRVCAHPGSCQTGTHEVYRFGPSGSRGSRGSR